MKRRGFIQTLSLSTIFPVFGKARSMKENTTITLLRHATLVLEINGYKILIDPMLSPKDTMDPVKNCGNEIRIPMVDLPISDSDLNQILSDVDAVVVTHTHRDHWDVAAQSKIAKTKTVFCQPVDEDVIRKQGFVNVVSIDSQHSWNGISITRTKGQHGTGEIGKLMGEVSGFVFKTKSKSVYLAGDTIWCLDVKDALGLHNPDVTIVNAGGAKFLSGDPITMTSEDVLQVRANLPQTKIIAVHMDTINHCFVKRSDLRNVIEENAASGVIIPDDGERIHL